MDLGGTVVRYGPVSVSAAAAPNAVRLSGFGTAGTALPLALPLAGLGLAAATAFVLRRRR